MQMPVKPFEHIIEMAGDPLRKHGNEVLTRSMQRNWSHGRSMPEMEETLHPVSYTHLTLPTTPYV